MEKKSFLIYFDSRPMVERLDDAERGKLFLELMRYAEAVKTDRTKVLDYLGEDGRGLSPEAWMAFGFIAGAIYRDTLKWLRTQESKEAKRRLTGEKASAVPTYPAETWGRGGF